MKLLAYLLMAIATMTGAISASTAYLVDLSKASDESLDGIRLATNAGAFDPATEEGAALAEELKNIREAIAKAEPPEPEPLLEIEKPELDLPELPQVETEKPGETQLAELGKLEPIAKSGEKLTPEFIAILRANDVRYVKVKSFRVTSWLSDWPSWVFIASIIALLGAAFVVRGAGKSQDADAANGAQVASPDEPGAIAQRIIDTIETLRGELAAQPDDRARNQLIIERFGDVQRSLVPAFAEARPRIITSLGMGGFAQVMDAFAATERQVNRAWSAAADGATHEALASADRAAELAPAILQRLRA